MSAKVVRFTIAIPIPCLNMGRSERLFMVGIGIMLAEILFIFLFIFFTPGVATSPPGNNAQPLNEELVLGSVTLVTANTKIAKGSKITQQYLREVNWPRDQVPEGAIRKTDDVENMFALISLPENQPILRSSISENPPFGEVGDLLPPGSRAVTLNIERLVGMEGWATPGAHVDVFLTYLDPKDSNNKTRVVVENAVVLSFNASTKPPNGMDKNSGTSGVNITTVTLSVPFQDAMKIQTALALGKPSLALRNPADNVTTAEKNTVLRKQFDRCQTLEEMQRVVE